ncbi:MAG: STAS/SEC14 domain-containing protein [Mesonia hippocampi]|uniref:STAS/SEC14 domain-containing protein n=1 Tax=Mesonia hippocampi TaxID=1628250 RepID=UPI003F9CC0FC
MIQQIDSLRVDTLVYELELFITEEDIKTIDTGIAFMFSEIDHVNLMIYINVEGESIKAMINQFQIGAKYWNKINRIAYVADKKHWQTIIAFDNLFTKFKEKYFDVDDMDNAWKWIAKN